MAKRILIVDDDVDFNGLLTDVFKQAGYELDSANDGDEALVKINESDYDLVVTDDRMTRVSGMELVKELSLSHPKLPIIMVSAYLETESIRRLINMGVGGVFIKPLNIIQLLRHAHNLVEQVEAPKKEENQDETVFYSAEGKPYHFKTYACKSAASRNFAEKLFEKKDFEGLLLLIGHQGSPYESICQEFVNFSEKKNEICKLRPGQIDLGDILAFHHKYKDSERITFALLKAEQLSEEERDTIIDLFKRQKQFDMIKTPVRFIVCLDTDVDSLYDTGKIDDDFYVFLSAPELKIPRLNEIRTDLNDIARRVLHESNHISQPPPLIDEDAEHYLSEKDWKGDMAEYEKIIVTATQLSDGVTITLDDINAASEGRSPTTTKAASEDIRSQLQELSEEYREAAQILSANNPSLIQSLITAKEQ